MTDEPRIFLSVPHMSGREQELVGEVFDSNFIAPAGPMIDRFEAAFCATTGHRAAAALSSGTGAMDIALRLLGVEQGDDVWVADLTFIGGVSPVRYHGANPVFLDVSADTWTLDPALLANELEIAARSGSLPKAVIPVDLYGQSCDLDQIVSLCDRYRIPVVVDSAEAMGARYKDRHAGKGAKFAIYSFNGNKIITTSGGGVLASDDDEMIARARYLSQQARQPVAHYEHTETGYNYRMPSLCAAVGVGQLEVLEERVRRRREIFSTYAGAFEKIPGVSMMPEAEYGTSNRWLTVITLDPTEVEVTPAEVCLKAEAQNVECRPVWKPMHQQPVFETARVVSNGTSDDLFTRGLCLPSGSAMSDQDVQRVIGVLSEALMGPQAG
ncbi:MAG: aminotransferase class I/II-fold pyridoxal phosphate-dependent enzyme [Rhodobiaceae bacterium]|nr:aminotransferase class I/II-fold pyridoxal phosphate-dependent enzyme [Rhodobiaceae bacterium]